jgi:hypothetical protein
MRSHYCISRADHGAPLLEPVIRRTFDIPTMVRLSVGPSWANLTEARPRGHGKEGQRRFVHDSPLEGAGFEPSVPRQGSRKCFGLLCARRHRQDGRFCGFPRRNPLGGGGNGLSAFTPSRRDRQFTPWANPDPPSPPAEPGGDAGGAPGEETEPSSGTRSRRRKYIARPQHTGNSPLPGAIIWQSRRLSPPGDRHVP